MGLVDLRGHGDDPEVRALLDPVAGRLLLGCRDGGELVGCIAGDLTGPRTFEIKTLFVAEPFRRRGIGTELVETIVEGGPADVFEAWAGPDEAGFFERRGFSVGPAVRRRLHCVRRVRAAAGSPEAVTAFTLVELEEAIRSSWSRETSADPDEWTDENPAFGQCDATALVVHGYLGGAILVADVVRDGARVDRHAWNRLPGGLAVDLTRSQFRHGERLGEPSVRELLPLDGAAERRALLVRRVAAALELPR